MHPQAHDQGIVKTVTGWFDVLDVRAERQPWRYCPTVEDFNGCLEVEPPGGIRLLTALLQVVLELKRNVVGALFTRVLLCVHMIMRLRSSVYPDCDSYTGVDDQAWLISFMDSELGLFDSERVRVETGPIGLKVWASQIKSSGYMS